MRLRVVTMAVVALGVLLLASPVAGALETEGLASLPTALEETPLNTDLHVEGEGVWREAYEQFSVGPMDTSGTGGLSYSLPAPLLQPGDDFELDMDGWTLWSNTQGGPTWGRTDYRAYGGSYSAYCVGSSVAAPGPYFNSLESTMVAGPYDLSDAVSVRLEFDCYVNTQPSFDWFYAYWSTDGTNWFGMGLSGFFNWAHRTVSMSGAAGESSVLVAFKFVSDSSVKGEGAYVDNAKLVVVDRHEEDTAELGYVRSWSTLENINATGYSSYECSSGGSNVCVKFTGDYLGWVARKSAGQGKAKVSLDYGEPVTVDLYSATPVWQQTVWETPGGLEWGTHKVFIEYTGTRNPSAIGWGINVDAFDVNGSLYEAPLRYQHNRGQVRYTGTWGTSWSTHASYLSFKRSNTAGDTFRLKFTGNHIAWVGLKAPAYGRASITLDGVSQGTVDLYAPTQQWESKIWSTGMPYGMHTLIVTCTGTKQAAASDYYIDADAFDVQGVLGWWAE